MISIKSYLGWLGILTVISSNVAWANSSILLQSYIGNPPEDYRYYVDFLIRTLGDLAPEHGAALKKHIETRLSLSPGPTKISNKIQTMANNGRKLFIEGEFNKSILTLETVRQILVERPALVASDQNLRELLYKVLLLLAHAYLRTNQDQIATDLVSEVIRSFPNRDLSLVQFGPELAQFYKSIRLKIDRQPRGTLLINSQPSGCLIFINEQFLGLSPIRAANLSPGRYRVYAQRPHAQGRVHIVHVTEGNQSIDINFGFDHVLQTEPFIGFRFTDTKASEKDEVSYATILGQMLDASTVLVLGFHRDQGRRALRGIAISTRTGHVIRSGMTILEPSPPSPDALKALGRFLVAGEVGTGIIIQHNQSNNLSWRPPQNGTRKQIDTKSTTTRILPWITLGAAIATLTPGITLMALNNKKTCPEDHCPQKYQTMTAGIILTGIGSISAIASGYFFYRKYLIASPPMRRTALWPWIGINQAGISFDLLF